jgi:hypothetical protein
VSGLVGPWRDHCGTQPVMLAPRARSRVPGAC